MSKKKIMFRARGEWFVVNEDGRITQHDRFQKNPNDFSGGWRLLGVSHHHWSRRWTTDLARIQDDPKLMLGGYVWDLDHGSTRTWGGNDCRVDGARFMD